MVLIVLLVIAILLQIFAAGVAIRLTRTTKYNSSWILFTIALVLMGVMRLDEFARALAERLGQQGTAQAHELVMPNGMYEWGGVATSLCFAVGVVMIQKVLGYMALREEQRRNSEKRILSAVIRAEENQRQIISKELHDGLGPLLSSAKMSMSALAAGSLDERQREIWANADYVLGEAVKGLREISNNLSPHVLDNFGVARALSTFINKLQPGCPMRIHFTTNLGGVRFDADKEVILYRVLCELVNNAMKHAGAENLWIDLQLERGGTILTVVRDDGRGFDSEAVLAGEQERGMGLSNIASRIGSIKGELRIESAPGEARRVRPGTKVTIRMGTK